MTRKLDLGQLRQISGGSADDVKFVTEKGDTKVTELQGAYFTVILYEHPQAQTMVIVDNRSGNTIFEHTIM